MKSSRVYVPGKCKGFTRDNKRCRYSINESLRYCYLHRDQDKRKAVNHKGSRPYNPSSKYVKQRLVKA